MPTAQTLPVNVLEYIPTRPGGDLQAVLNLEYRIPIVSRVTFDLFNDAAINGVLRPSQLGLDPTAAGVVAAAISEPGFSEFEDFEQSADLGRHEFQAAHVGGRGDRGVSAHRECAVPFLLRVQLPAADAHAHAANRARGISIPTVENSLKQLGVYNTQVVPSLQTFLEQLQSSQTIPPSLLEPKSTFRFTVSRTF